MPVVLATDKTRACSGNRPQNVCQQLHPLTVWNCSPCFSVFKISKGLGVITPLRQSLRMCFLICNNMLGNRYLDLGTERRLYSQAIFVLQKPSRTEIVAFKHLENNLITTVVFYFMYTCTHPSLSLLFDLSFPGG